MRLYGIEMHLPEHKMPGYYSQIVKALASTVNIFDRDKQLVIVKTEKELKLVISIMEKYRLTYECIPLLLLPPNSSRDARADDYGFTSPMGNAYLYADLILLFKICHHEPFPIEIKHGIMQMEEFIVASFSQSDTNVYCIEAHLADTIRGIAMRYHVAIEFI
jgi:hypothetical protein